MKKILPLALALALVAALLAGCAATDVILKYSPASLETILGKFPAIVTDSTQTDHYFTLSADGETLLKISNNYSLTDEDIAIQTPLKPFLDAGLDSAKLGAGYRADDTSLYLVADFGAGSGEQNTLTKALFESVKADRSVLTYHADLDHYGIKLPSGKFEWAKDESTNDKDIVFVLNPEPFIAAGVDPSKIDGWVFAKVETKDDAGRAITVDKLLKPFNLK